MIDNKKGKKKVKTVDNIIINVNIESKLLSVS